jgi:hypothetical protein
MVTREEVEELIEQGRIIKSTGGHIRKKINVVIRLNELPKEIYLLQRRKGYNRLFSEMKKEIFLEFYSAWKRKIGRSRRLERLKRIMMGNRGNHFFRCGKDIIFEVYHNTILFTLPVEDNKTIEKVKEILFKRINEIEKKMSAIKAKKHIKKRKPIKRGVIKREPISEEEKKLIIEKRKSGLGIKQIAKLFNHSIRTIDRLLKPYGLNGRLVGSKRRSLVEINQKDKKVSVEAVAET